MPKRVPPLTQLQIKAARPKEKPYKLSDGGGLYVEVMPAGGKLWRMKYRQPDGKENRLSFGSSGRKMFSTRYVRSSSVAHARLPDG